MSWERSQCRWWWWWWWWLWSWCQEWYWTKCWWIKGFDQTSGTNVLPNCCWSKPSSEKSLLPVSLQSHMSLSAGFQWTFELGRGGRESERPWFPGLVSFWHHVQGAPVARLHHGEGVLVHQGDQEGDQEGEEEGGDASLMNLFPSAHPSLTPLACPWVLT